MASSTAVFRWIGDRRRLPVSHHGFRRVGLVRIVVTDAGRWAELVGSSHRRPCVRRVPVRVGLAIARSGVAVQVVDRRRARAGSIDSNH